LEDHVPGKDAISKSMHKTIEYTEDIREGSDLEPQGLTLRDLETAPNGPG
jgi:hypothetical protein